MSPSSREVPEHQRYSYVDDGQAATSREVAACQDEELETTMIRSDDFKAKMAYWREHGAPGYIGPRATKDAA